VLADGLAYVVSENPFGRVDGDVLALKSEVHALGTEFIQECSGCHQKKSLKKNGYVFLRPKHPLRPISSNDAGYLSDATIWFASTNAVCVRFASKKNKTRVAAKTMGCILSDANGRNGRKIAHLFYSA
jgi:hypothetical protein